MYKVLKEFLGKKLYFLKEYSLKPFAKQTANKYKILIWNREIYKKNTKTPKLIQDNGIENKKKNL